MTRFAAVATILLSLCFPSLAQNTPSTRLYVDLGLLRLRIDPGTLFDVPVVIHNAPDGASPSNVRVHLDVTNGVMESFVAPMGWSCTTGAQGLDCAVPTLDSSCRCSETAHLGLRMPGGSGGGETKLMATVSSELPQEFPAPATKTLQIYRRFAVTTTSDVGPGSFRDAIETVNRSCGDEPCKIVFEIATPPTGGGWFTITPATPLPAITAKRVVVDALRQTEISGESNPRGPEVAIDGSLAGEGLVMLSPCEAVIAGLALGNFSSNQGLWFAPSNDPALCHFDALDRREVARNSIGIDPTGEPWPNLRGLRLDGATGSVHDNIISHNTYSGIWRWAGNPLGLVVRNNFINLNGASGVLLAGPNATVFSNVISGNAQMGVALAGENAEIRQNSMSDNGGLGIDRGLDGIDPLDETDARVNPPTLLSATYDAEANKTVVTFTVHARLSGIEANSFDFYANRGPDGDGEIPLGTFYPFANPTRVEIPGDLRGMWIKATTMRYTQVFAKPPARTATTNTVIGENKMMSELSAAVLVP